MGHWAFHLLLAYALLLQPVLGSAADVRLARAGVSSPLAALCTPSKGENTPAAPHVALCCVLGCTTGLTGPAPARAVHDLTRTHTRIAHQPARQEASAARSVASSFDARGPPARA